jgi:ABC-type transport system involved in Fe-S cluster assembly fused permease/ATPase subunit
MERFNSASNYLRNSRLAVDTSTSVFNPVMGIVFQFGGWIVWYVGGYDTLRGEMTLGSLMAFFGYLWMFYGPLSSLTQFTNWLTQFVTQAHRIFEILDTPKEIVDPGKPVVMGEVKGDIVFDDVTFGYARSNPVLQDINLHITPGEMVGVVGRSGSGKTTIVNLMCRFYDVNEGRVLIDGKDVREVESQALRRNIGVVLQEPFLFRGSIWQNLTYGKPEATPEEVLTAAKAANAHDFILHHPHGYDTWVGERGAGLSGGERQRVSIARVLLTDPKILILDEATSSVDAESEAAIQAALRELVKGRTTIAIAHRLSTLRSANRILVVDQGKIVESGTHEELLRQDGLFARLMKLQGQSAPSTVDHLLEQEKLLKGEDTRLSEIGGLPDPRSHHPRWLAPDQGSIHLGNLGALHVTIPKEMIYGGVYAIRCMPVHFPSEYISLRYLDHEKREIEVGLLRNLKEWPEEARRLVNESLVKRYFVHTIQSITMIRSYSGYLNLKVETDLGPMDFMMRWQHDRAHDYGHRGKMLLDTDDNRYLIPDVSLLPPNEQKLFQRYIYW